MKLWFLGWLWRSLSNSGFLKTIASTGQIDDLRRNLSVLATNGFRHEARLVALESAAKPTTPDPPPADANFEFALHSLVTYIVVAAYQGSDQAGVLSRIDMIWGPIRDHLVKCGVLASTEGNQP